jgi:hypothetical protein
MGNASGEALWWALGPGIFFSRSQALAWGRSFAPGFPPARRIFAVKKELALKKRQVPPPVE